MPRTVHALMPDEQHALPAVEAIVARELCVDPGTYDLYRDRLGPVPEFRESALAGYVLVGGATIGLLGMVVGFFIGWLDYSLLPTPASTLLGLLAGTAMGAFTSALAGIGAFRSGITRAARDLEEGRVLLGFQLKTWREAETADRILRTHGALDVRHDVA